MSILPCRVAGLAALAAAAGLLLPACAAAPAARPAGPGRPAGTTLVASFAGNVPRYTAPGGRPAGEVPATWHGVRAYLPVIGERRGWLHVRLEQRPNQSTAWVRAGAARLGATPYRIVISLATTHLTLYKDDRMVFTAPAGVGARDDPTPAGTYFVAFLEAPPPSQPGYGAFIMVTSAHSDAISDWEGSGDAVIGIHGPLGGDRLIGTAGSRISHGCIRLHEADLLRLRDVPPGTPINIVR
jgi:lipoprotein-anchoring transpeptidase ErfK/SrfK